jgi:hypothetical protein
VQDLQVRHETARGQRDHLQAELERIWRQRCLAARALHLHRVPAPRYRAPVDPALLIAGEAVRPTSRHERVVPAVIRDDPDLPAPGAVGGARAASLQSPPD